MFVSSLASSLLGTAVVVAGKAASAAYSTAKDVYYTLQARNAVRIHHFLKHQLTCMDVQMFCCCVGVIILTGNVFTWGRTVRQVSLPS